MAINRPPSLAVGTKVNGRYLITNIVGQGGLGTVYQVREDTFGQSNIYALKETFDLSEGARDQFEREARWLEKLNHPNIPRVRHFFEWNERLYLLMDFVTGENLEYKLVRGGNRALPEADVLRWILPVADALHYLHTQKPPIIHRDIKPANIIVTPGGYPALVDLGIAKEHMPGLPNVTATFIRKAGTEGYAPPEQYTSNGTTGPWSDIYSLGATMYHLLTGHIPSSAIERAALDGQLVAPRTLNPKISVQTEGIIMRALAIRPQDRFATMHEMEQALIAVAREQGPRPSATHPPQGAQFTCPRCKRPMSAQAPLCAECARELSQLSGPLPAYLPRNPSHPSLPNLYQSTPPLRPQQPMSAPRPPTSGPHVSTPAPVSNSQPGRRVSHGAIERGKGASYPTSSDSIPPMRISGSISSGKPLGSGGLRRDSRPQRVTTRPAAALRTVSHHWAIIGSICVVLLLGVGILLGTHVITLGPTIDLSTPQSTVSGYFNALKSQDYHSAYAYLSDQATSAQTYDQFVTIQRNDVSNLGTITDFTLGAITPASIDGDQVQVLVTRGGAKVTYSVTVSNTGDRWMIDSVSN